MDFNICTVWKVPVFGVILVRMQKNANQNNFEYGHILHSDGLFNALN